VNEHKTDYSYDDHNRILSISNNQTGDKESYVYYDSPADANGMIGRLKSHSIAGQIGAIVTSLQYDPFSRLGQQTTSNGANKTFEVRNNNYNDNSLLTSTVFSSTVDATDNSNYTLIYAYDASGLLAQYQKFPESSPSQASYSEQYQFDGNSNVIARTTRIDGTSKNISYTYDTSNRLTNYNDGSNHTPFAYDADGRMTTDDQGNAYTYDNFFDMITSVSNSTAGPIANYTYYPDGSRQTKTIAQSTGQPLPISFYHDAAGNLVNEVQSDGVSSSYLISPEGTQARYVKDSSGKDVVPSQYYTKDNKKVNKTLGSNPQITSYNYSPYGEKLGDTDKAPASIKDNPFGYEDTAMTDKETGLILLGARYYNPKLMRFMSMDSYPLENKYSYTNGDPINFSDPLGHMSGADTANLIIGIVTTIVAIAAAVPTGGASAAAATSAQAARAAGGLVMAKFVGQQALNGAARGVVAAVGMGVATNSVDAAFGEKKSAGEWGKSLALSATIGLVAGGVSGAASAGSALRTAASNGVMGDDSVAGFNFISKSQGNKVLQDPTNRKNMVSLIKLGFSAKTAEKLIKAKIIVKRLLPIALGSIAVGASVKGTHNLIRGVLKNPNRMAEEQDVEEMSVSQMIKNEESSKASPEPKKPDGVEFSRELSPFFNSEKEQL
jgi:RHS repeat-associated protein